DSSYILYCRISSRDSITANVSVVIYSCAIVENEMNGHFLMLLSIYFAKYLLLSPFSLVI
ncbi:unnamed protein product, partial [Brugia timori]|uniref:Ovule protein n=1 Tax=Brugia timori TaxID=42155 RepID=A0A0R3QEB8_9BILA